MPDSAGAEAAALYHETFGDPGAPALLLSAGLGGSAGYWAPNLPALAARFHVIAYDHRGTGRSDRALADGSVDAMAADMLALLDALGIDRAHVIGHALGGLAALALARLAPARLDRVVVVNGWATLDPQTARCFAVRLALLNGAGARAYLEAQPLFLYPATYLSEHDAALRTETETQLAHWPGDATMIARIAGARGFDCTGWAHEVAAPVLLVSADDDLLVPWPCSARLAGLLAPAGHIRLGWGGHACNITDPGGFADAVLPFLES